MILLALDLTQLWYCHRLHPEKTKPKSPSFYTSHASYYDYLYRLETALQRCHHTLTMLGLLPLPAFAHTSLLPAPLLAQVPEHDDNV